MNKVLECNDSFGRFKYWRFLFHKYFWTDFKWVVWAIHNYTYEINGVVLLIYLVSDEENNIKINSGSFLLLFIINI